MVGLLDGGKTLRISITVQTQYRHVTDGQTDRQTSCHGIIRAVHTRRAVKMTAVASLSHVWAVVDHALLTQLQRSTELKILR